MSKAKTRPALGRGLGALLPNQAKGGEARPSPAPASPLTPASDTPRTGVQTLPIELLEPNPEQPRKHFDPIKLDELASSIKTQGLLQPIVVSPQHKPGSTERKYLIIAGERRWRASQKAGLHEVPVVIRAVEEDDRLELALV